MSRDGFISWGGARYGVPWPHAGRRLVVKERGALLEMIIDEFGVWPYDRAAATALRVDLRAILAWGWVTSQPAPAGQKYAGVDRCMAPLVRFRCSPAANPFSSWTPLTQTTCLSNARLLRLLLPALAP